MMGMMENTSLNPIDLRVPKSTRNSQETTHHPEVHPAVNLFYPRNNTFIPSFSNHFLKLMSPTDKCSSMNNINIFNDINRFHSKEDNEHIARPTSSESGVGSPSTSPGSSQNDSDDQSKVKDGKNEMAGLKRRLSNGSTSSSLSNYSGDSNNNEKSLNNEMGVEKTNMNLSPEKKKLKTISEEYGLTDLNVPFAKTDLFLENPVSSNSYTHEIDVCDSSTRSTSTRPFKAITNGLIIDPLPLTGPLGDFETFRQNILSKVNNNNKSTNHNMRRHCNANNTHITDPAYWEKRKRNNEAAKRSRDARRRKEDEVAIRCAYLEQERILIMQENKMLKEALQKYQYGFLRQMN